MDRKIMELIDMAAETLPQATKNVLPYRLYTEGKATLIALFPGQREYEYICKTLAEKYGI